MAFQFIAASGEARLPDLAVPGRPLATMSYSLDRPFPAPRAGLRSGCMVLGGRVNAARAAETAAECRRRGITTVILGFSPCPGLELLRFCEILRRRGIRPVVSEQSWQEGCGAAMLISTAVSGGTLEQRLREAKARSGEIWLDLERTRRLFPLPCPDGAGLPLSGDDLERLLGGGDTPFFSEALQCRIAVLRDPVRFLLFDDADTLLRKTALAQELGIGRGLLLVPEEWSPEELLKAERTDKIPAAN